MLTLKLTFIFACRFLLILQLNANSLHYNSIFINFPIINDFSMIGMKFVFTKIQLIVFDYGLDSYIGYQHTSVHN